MEDRFVDAGKGGFEGEVEAEAGGHREGEWVGCEAGREVQLIKKNIDVREKNLQAR